MLYDSDIQTTETQPAAVSAVKHRVRQSFE